jgi:mitochondrial fission protein ELM1
VNCQGGLLHRDELKNNKVTDTYQREKQTQVYEIKKKIKKDKNNGVISGKSRREERIVHTLLENKTKKKCGLAHRIFPT